MKEVDTIIVGQGLAGSSLAYELMKRGQNVLVVDRSDEGSSSRVAAGLITPLTGKGMNPAWRQEEYLAKAIKHYQELEASSEQRVYFPQPVLRIFSSEKEQKKWAGKEGGQSQWGEVEEVIPEAVLSSNQAIKMKDGAWVDTITYLSVIRDLLIKEGSFREVGFAEEDVVFKDNQIIWSDVVAQKIILCQGAYGLGELGREGSSSWFSDIPHRSAKGEILTLKIKGLDASVRYHANGWLAPRGNNQWKAGASYDWVNLDSNPTAEGRDEVLTRLKTWLSDDLEVDVVGHVAGVRPIIRNSRPVIGFHADKPEVGFFNGLGSKGTLMAPAVAEHFAMHLCGECELDEELNLHFTNTVMDSFKIESITGSLLHRAHGIIKDVIRPDEVAIDATVGNGHDTLFLAKCVGGQGRVVGFDIQEDAISSTRERLNEAGISDDLYDLYQESHAKLSTRVSGGVAVVMFNLGYLPSGDKEIITKVESTMEALKAALSQLRQGGVLSVMCYPGHSGGDTEAGAVKAWFAEVHGDRYDVTLFQREGAKETTPFLLVAQKQ